MMHVEQTEFADYSVDPPIRGNCLAACVASIFEVTLSRFENVYNSQALRDWLNRYAPGIGLIAHTYWDLESHEVRSVSLGSRRPEGYTNLPGLTPWIAIVNSPRTEHMHCVVMVGEDLAWDPHPQREMGVGDQTGDYAFVLDRPEKLILQSQKT